MLGLGLRMGDVAARRIGVTATAVSYLPTLASTPLVLYCMYKLIPAYTGPSFALIRASDGATLDVYPGADGQSPDLSATPAFLSGTTATIRRYDQTCNGNHEVVPSGGQAASWMPGNVQFGRYSATYASTAGWSRFPDAVAANRQNVAMVSVLGVAGGNGILNSVGNVNDSSSNFAISISSIKASLIGTGINQVNLTYPADIGVVIANSSATGSAIRVNNRRATIGTQVGIATAGGSMGRYGLLTAIASPGSREDFATILYPALSLADEAALQTSLASIFGIPAQTDQVLFSGDSLSIGFASATGSPPARLFAQNAIKRAFFSTVGVVGQQQQSITALNSTYAALYDGTNFSGKHILVNNAGTNDIYNGRSADQIYADLTSFFTAQRAAGWDVVQLTILKQSVFGSGSGETIRQDVNNRLVTNAGALGLTVIDIAADSRLSNPADTAYFFDGTHLTPAGNAVTESLIRATLNTKLAA